MQVLKIIQFSIVLAAQILPLIKQVEDVFGSGNGAQKKEAVKSAVSMSAQLAGMDHEYIDKKMEVVDHAIDANVAVLNETGVFKKND